MPIEVTPPPVVVNATIADPSAEATPPPASTEPAPVVAESLDAVKEAR